MKNRNQYQHSLSFKDYWEVLASFVAAVLTIKDIVDLIQTDFSSHLSWSFYLSFGLFIIFGFYSMIKSKKEIKDLKDKSPNVIFKDSGFLELTISDIDIYGKSSLVGMFLSKDPIYLFYLSFSNLPKLKNINTALGAEVLIKIIDNNYQCINSYLGRWIDTPEKEFGVIHKKKDLACSDYDQGRLGVAILGGKGDDFKILNSDLTDNRSDGTIWNMPILSPGKYSLIAIISGENFENKTKVYDLQNLKDDRLIFNEKKDQRKYLKRFQKENKKNNKIWSKK